MCFYRLVISVYFSSLPVAHLCDAPRRRLVVTGDSARIQDETTENSAWFFNVLGVQHRHTGPRVNVSSERQLIILVGQPGTRTHTCRDPKHYVHESYALPTELIGRLMCFYRILMGLFYVCEGTKTWGHGREQAILSGQFLGYLSLLVFSEKHNRLTCFFFFFFQLDYGCTFGI